MTDFDAIRSLQKQADDAFARYRQSPDSVEGEAAWHDFYHLENKIGRIKKGGFKTDPHDREIAALNARIEKLERSNKRMLDLLEILSKGLEKQKFTKTVHAMVEPFFNERIAAAIEERKPQQDADTAIMKGHWIALDTRTKDAVRRVAAVEDIAVEARLKNLEDAAIGLRFMGVFQRAIEYKRGMVVTHDSGLWIACENVKPNCIPGQTSEWQLALKSNR